MGDITFKMQRLCSVPRKYLRGRTQNARANTTNGIKLSTQTIYVTVYNCRLYHLLVINRYNIHISRLTNLILCAVNI